MAEKKLLFFAFFVCVCFSAFFLGGTAGHQDIAVVCLRTRHCNSTFLMGGCDLGVLIICTEHVRPYNYPCPNPWNGHG